MRPKYQVWLPRWLGFWGWWKFPSDYWYKVEIDWVESWPRSLAAVNDATLNLLPPTLAAFIATAVGKRTLEIKHVARSDWGMIYGLLEWMGKVSIVPTERTSTLCFLSENIHCGKAVVSSPLGRYCLSCGSSIVTTPQPLLWVSSLDTISSNGRSNYPRTAHDSYSLTMESRSANRKCWDVQIPIPMRWSLIRTPVCGKLTLWHRVGGNYVPTPTTNQYSTITVETGHVMWKWR